MKFQPRRLIYMHDKIKVVLHKRIDLWIHGNHIRHSKLLVRIVGSLRRFSSA